MVKSKVIRGSTSRENRNINYCLNQWEKLEAYLLDGRLEMDNNRAKRRIKPVVIGRKNFLFSNTPKEAKASAIIYSIVVTAKENRLKPFEYLAYLLDQLPNIIPDNQVELDALLPWSASIPTTCKALPRRWAHFLCQYILELTFTSKEDKLRLAMEYLSIRIFKLEVI